MEPTPDDVLPEPAAPSVIPPPPTPIAPGEPWPSSPPPRAGELTAGWATVFWVAWVGVAAGFVAVWVSSRNTGLSTWWLGPEVRPRPLVLSLVPLVLPIFVAVLALRRVAWVPFGGIVAAAASAAIGAGDLGRVNGYAAVELALAAGGLAVSLASFAGMYRAPSR